MRRVMSLMLVVVLMMSLLAGCGDKVAAGAVVAGDSLPQVDMIWYVIGNGQPEDTAKIEEKVNAYLKEKKLNVTLKIQCYDWGSYDQKMRTTIAAREKFDICFTSSWTNNYQQQAVKGAYVALNDLFEQYAPQTKAMLGDDFLKGSQIDGINYAIPANKEKAHQWGFIVRKDMVDKYNMDLSGVKTLEDMEPFLKIIKENEPTMYALEALNGESPFKLLDFDRVGDDKYPGVVWNDSADMKVFNEFEAPESIAYFNTMRDYYQKGYIRQDAATVTDFNADLSAGKIFASVKSLKPGKDAEMSASTGFEWTQINITPAIISNRDTSGSMQAISTTSENPERALMLLELFNTDPYFNNLINFGIEGVHYVKVNETQIKPGPDSEKYNPGLGWMFGNQFINLLWENEDPAKWEQFNAFNASATGTKTLGFIFDPSSVKNEIAACNNAWDQYVPSLETGAVDPVEYLPKALAAFKEAGSDKIIAEKQKQLEAWLAKQK
ncbi:ABC transporter substrate-binding protein [Fusibacter sp. 3D3]|uniref:ABC transporter substrate-binding protein n=1 Tax=Fusibacter sp. 3D3 TaxID=1048380 RepID=UPI00085329EB|nr:ABC transporter substrate-binding protein [Fusibacter sp. 3D3]GAU77301.1 multiple sugar ABC transporter substrate-binding protein [Fusibacter sp. 3D3]